MNRRVDFVSWLMLAIIVLCLVVFGVSQKEQVDVVADGNQFIVSNFEDFLRAIDSQVLVTNDSKVLISSPMELIRYAQLLSQRKSVKLINLSLNYVEVEYLNFCHFDIEFINNIDMRSYCVENAVDFKGLGSVESPFFASIYGNNHLITLEGSSLINVWAGEKQFINNLYFMGYGMTHGIVAVALAHEIEFLSVHAQVNMNCINDNIDNDVCFGGFLGEGANQVSIITSSLNLSAEVGSNQKFGGFIGCADIVYLNQCYISLNVNNLQTNTNISSASNSSQINHKNSNANNLTQTNTSITNASNSTQTIHNNSNAINSTQTTIGNTSLTNRQVGGICYDVGKLIINKSDIAVISAGDKFCLLANSAHEIVLNDIKLSDVSYSLVRKVNQLSINNSQISSSRTGVNSPLVCQVVDNLSADIDVFSQFNVHDSILKINFNCDYGVYQGKIDKIQLINSQVELNDIKLKQSSVVSAGICQDADQLIIDKSKVYIEANDGIEGSGVVGGVIDLTLSQSVFNVSATDFGSFGAIANEINGFTEVDDCQFEFEVKNCTDVGTVAVKVSNGKAISIKNSTFYANISCLSQVDSNVGVLFSSVSISLNQDDLEKSIDIDRVSISGNINAKNVGGLICQVSIVNHTLQTNTGNTNNQESQEETTNKVKICADIELEVVADSFGGVFNEFKSSGNSQLEFASVNINRKGTAINVVNHYGGAVNYVENKGGQLTILSNGVFICGNVTSPTKLINVSGGFIGQIIGENQAKVAVTLSENAFVNQFDNIFDPSNVGGVFGRIDSNVAVDAEKVACYLGKVNNLIAYGESKELDDNTFWQFDYNSSSKKYNGLNATTPFLDNGDLLLEYEVYIESDSFRFSQDTIHKTNNVIDANRYLYKVSVIKQIDTINGKQNKTFYVYIPYEVTKQSTSLPSTKKQIEYNGLDQYNELNILINQSVLDIENRLGVDVDYIVKRVGGFDLDLTNCGEHNFEVEFFVKNQVFYKTFSIIIVKGDKDKLDIGRYISSKTNNVLMQANGQINTFMCVLNYGDSYNLSINGMTIQNTHIGHFSAIYSGKTDENQSYQSQLFPTLPGEYTLSLYFSPSNQFSSQSKTLIHTYPIKILAKKVYISIENQDVFVNNDYNPLIKVEGVNSITQLRLVENISSIALTQINTKTVGDISQSILHDTSSSIYSLQFFEGIISIVKRQAVLTDKDFELSVQGKTLTLTAFRTDLLVSVNGSPFTKQTVYNGLKKGVYSVKVKTMEDEFFYESNVISVDVEVKAFWTNSLIFSLVSCVCFVVILQILKSKMQKHRYIKNLKSQQKLYYKNLDEDAYNRPIKKNTHNKNKKKDNQNNQNDKIDN